MRAVTFQGKQHVSVETVAAPRLVAPTDAIVKVRLAGICGSDLHPYRGRETLDRGATMGHEAVGEVVEVGGDVRALRKGDVVFGPFTTSCGACFFCRIGLTCRCEKGELFGVTSGGRGLGGLQAELARVPLAETTLVRVPEGVSETCALLLGDVASTGWFCAEMAEVRAGGTYAVIGCGPVGVCAALAARVKGADRVFAIDLVPARLALAARAGATPIDASREDPVQVVRAATSGRGADAALEAVGSAESERLAIDLVRPGGTVAAVGVHAGATFAFTPPQAYDKNLTYRVGRCPARRIIDELAPRVRDGSLGFDLAAIVSHVVPLSDAARAYVMFDAKEDGCTKVVLQP
jgi:threonine dehydrogenase-like Zn-dependent dehydrogenase